MLSRLSIKNFRLLRDVTIDVEPGKPIVLIGPNGSGKSSVIQVLDLLGRAARDGLKQALQAFGGAGAIASATAGPAISELMVLDVAMAGVGYAREADLYYSVHLTKGSIERETLRYSADGWEHTASRDATSVRYTEAKMERTHTLAQGSSQKLAFELLKPALSTPVYWAQQDLSTIRVYDGFLTTPLWTRDVREGQLSPFDSTIVAPCERIDRRGLDLVNALHYLQSSHPDEWEELERSFKAEFPFVQRLEFPADPAGGRIALGWRDRRQPGVRMYGHQMSEGMTTYLCLLAAILTPDPAVAIAFDEPDRHLHPSALRRVVYLLEKLSERTAVFVATHSDRLLDHLSDPAGSVRVCEPTEDGVSIQTLNRDALDAWRAKFTISELRRRGHIDPENASAAEP